MNLICKNDAFMNAFVNTQIATVFLNMDIENLLLKRLMSLKRKYLCRM